MQFYQLETTLILQQHLARRFQIYQRIDDLEGDGHWQLAAADPLTTISEDLPISSPKGLFFGDRENLFSFDGNVFRETIPSPAPFALFGVQEL